MQLLFMLTLPRDAASVPIVRRLCRSSFGSLGVADECVTELELLLAEACTNVLKHADTGDDQYEVEVRTNGLECDIRVRDAGRRFDDEAVGRHAASTSAEGGRGIHLMRVLCDRLQFVSEDSGTVVHLRKTLELAADSPLRLVAPGQAASSSRS
jgi:serine/threonine-protein kinase RsbW